MNNTTPTIMFDEGLPNEPSNEPSVGLIKRTLLSMFIVLNLVTVCVMNLPSSLCTSIDETLGQNCSEETLYRLRLSSWRLQQYAYFSGLDNKWQMFGRQSRFNWWYDIRAVYSDGVETKQVLLPIPNQSARTLSEQMLFDLKERKFELNIYLNETARECYSRYLARQFPEHENLPIQSVRWHLGFQYILPPDEAVEKKQLHDPRCYVQLLNDFAIHSPGQPATENGNSTLADATNVDATNVDSSIVGETTSSDGPAIRIGSIGTGGNDDEVISDANIATAERLETPK